MAKDTKGSRHGRDRHLDDCFGRGDEDARRDCPCPPACQRLCASSRFEDWNAPRIHRYQGKYRPYTPVPNAIMRSWEPALPDPNPAVKLCYLGLISYAQGSRWITERTALVAKGLGFKAKRFHQYCAELQRYDLIRRVPLREVSTHIFSNHYAIVLLDLPEAFPGHLDDEDVAILRRRYEGEDFDEAEEDIDEDDGLDLDDLAEPDDLDGNDLDLDEAEEDIDEDDGLDLDDLAEPDEAVIVAPPCKGSKRRGGS